MAILKIKWMSSCHIRTIVVELLRNPANKVWNDLYCSHMFFYDCKLHFVTQQLYQKCQNTNKYLQHLAPFSLKTYQMKILQIICMFCLYCNSVHVLKINLTLGFKMKGNRNNYHWYVFCIRVQTLTAIFLVFSKWAVVPAVAKRTAIHAHTSPPYTPILPGRAITSFA